MVYFVVTTTETLVVISILRCCLCLQLMISCTYYNIVIDTGGAEDKKLLEGTYGSP